MLSTDLSASLRHMAATFPLSDDEQKTLRQAALMLEQANHLLDHVKERGLENARLAHASFSCGGAQLAYEDVEKKLRDTLEGH